MDRVNTANAAYPQVRLAPLPQRDYYQTQTVAEYDLYESDAVQYHPPPPPAHQRQTQHPYHPPPPHNKLPLSSPTSASSSSSASSSNWTIAGRPSSVDLPVSSQSYTHNNTNDNVKVQVPLDFDLGCLSLDDRSDTSSITGLDLNSPLLRFAEGESQKPVERSGYVDDTRFSGSDQGYPLSYVPPSTLSEGAAAASPIVNAAFVPMRSSPASQRTSMDSTHSSFRAYAAANNNPSGSPYMTSPQSLHNNPVHQAADYAYGNDYHRPPPAHGQDRPRPRPRGPPQPYGQYPQQDPRYSQQLHQYPGGYTNGYQQAGNEQYGQEYYPESQHAQYPPHNQQPHHPNGRPGFRPHGPGFGGPRPFPVRPGGANLQPSPSMRGPGPGRPRPMMMGPGGPGGQGAPGPYGPRPPHRGDTGNGMGPGPVRPGGPAGGPNMAPRRRTLTLEVLNEMRQRARNTNDPATQLDYAKALIEAAVTFGNDDPDPKRQKKNKEALFLEGLKIIKRLATTGVGIGKPAYPEAQFFLANCYGNGSLGLQIDHDKAFNLYVQASKQNHPASTYRTAVCYEIGAGTKKDSSRAVQSYRKAAALGDTAGMYKLGMVILKGMLGQHSNPREAITWLKRAASNADEDNPHALHELGLCFEKAGIPTVIPDEGYSRELFTQAAGFGYAPSQFKLGHCYEYGALTCPVDPRRSIAWYTRAAEQGDAESELGLSGWYLTGAEGVLKQSDTEAYLWARKAADKGLSRAEYAVGYYSEVGIGVKQDLDEARRWYLRSAAQGNNRAKKRLVDMKKLGAMRRIRHDRARQADQQGPDDENCKVM
ncbi:hypothetical protein KI688_007658 [Linnemannia hyalina]|uniref:HCP-like protein n=1 Tax=Linnemannia hyalina TaxID=64524 RepID=A0A9P8BLX7_9FUNG|nr:hypothetical protein KI688_007658 [Linnemannia hyalina]